METPAIVIAKKTEKRFDGRVGIVQHAPYKVLASTPTHYKVLHRTGVAFFVRRNDVEVVLAT